MNEALETPDQILRWRSDQRSQSGFHYETIPLSQTRRWRLREGRIEHETGRFFAVVAIGAKSSIGYLDGRTQPIIAQPEIGTLGFLLRRNAGRCDVLVQAKTEPGNVGAVQLAPSVQATLSNQNRAHGGAATPYLGYFVGAEAGLLASDQQQSEQGTRFVAKYNRNVTRLLEAESPAPAGDCWRWCSVEALLGLLHQDYVINTDARSVLVCSPWELLGPNGSPFSLGRGSGGFDAGLFDSYHSDIAERTLETLLDRLGAARAASNTRLHCVPIDDCRGWAFDDWEAADRGRRHFRVSYHRIHTLDREVADWDQPLLSDFHPIDVVLVCQKRMGVLHFLLRHAAEIGFREGVQFGPTLQIAFADGVDDEVQSRVAALLPHGTTRADVWASDEGGRFDHNRARYRIVELPEELDCDDGASASWATLSQIRVLLRMQGGLTNEARSALSLLLPFLWQYRPRTAQYSSAAPSDAHLSADCAAS